MQAAAVIHIRCIRSHACMLYTIGLLPLLTFGLLSVLVSALWPCCITLCDSAHFQLCCVGLVFFAFGLNLVDCGGLLGGRLGSNVPPKQAKAKMEPAIQNQVGTPTIGRTYTL